MQSGVSLLGYGLVIDYSFLLMWLLLDLTEVRVISPDLFTLWNKKIKNSQNIAKLMHFRILK
jgi:hypothetical protein